MAILLAVFVNSIKQLVRDRILYVVLFVSALILGFSYLLSTLTIVASRKILLDFSLSALSMAGLGVAIFIGIVSLAREVENRVIYTILTKPVSRGQYILGQFLGGAFVLLVCHLLLAGNILLILALMGEAFPIGFTQCVLLIFFENLILLAISYLFSVFSSSVVSACLTFSFFLIGRSSLSLQAMAEKAHTEEARAIAKGFYYIFPNLERFNLRDLVSYGREFPAEMLPYGVTYSLAYVVVVLCITQFIFNRRDLP